MLDAVGEGGFFNRFLGISNDYMNSDNLTCFTKDISFGLGGVTFNVSLTKPVPKGAM